MLRLEAKRTDMKTLIVFNHPYDGSYCNAILESVQEGLKLGGHKCKLIHLDKDGFDPVMRGKDLMAFVQAGKVGEEALRVVDPIVMQYKKKLEWAEHLVMIFPIWWMSMPAMMKGFVDKVIFPSVAYNMDGGRLKSRLLALRQGTVITTMNTQADVYREMFNNSVEGSLIKGTFNQIGIHDVRWISLNKVKQSGDEKRREWLDDLRDIFSV